MSLKNACQKCSGTGKFVGWSGRIVGDCFACKGTGSIDAAASNSRAWNGVTHKLVDSPLILAMQTAKDNGSVSPSLRIERYRFKWWERYADKPRIYIEEDQSYILGAPVKLGHIELNPGEDADPEWRHYALSEERVEEVLAILRDDVEEQLVKYGRMTGKCGCCGRELSDPESIDRGIGPICADNYGF